MTMLILIRRIGETITIGHDVTVTVVGVRGGQVSLGIAAPRNLAVHRQEVYARIAATSAALPDHPEMPVSLPPSAARDTFRSDSRRYKE